MRAGKDFSVTSYLFSPLSRTDGHRRKLFLSFWIISSRLSDGSLAELIGVGSAFFGFPAPNTLAAVVAFLLFAVVDV